MNSALSDELLSINAIYGSDTLSYAPESDVYILKIPQTDTALQIFFPISYPDDPPTILGPQSSGVASRKGFAKETVSIAQDVLGRSFHPGDPCVFDLVQQVTEELPQTIQGNSHEATEEEYSEKDMRGTQAVAENRNVLEAVNPKWILSDVITEKKSVFLARAARVSHPDEARLFIQHLQGADKKVAKATHNITAWRILGSGSSDVAYQDCDDDGENAAGGRLLHLLQIMDLWNVLVVVSRWYGGIHLGPDRFRCISNVARDALLKGGFDKSTKLT